MNIRTILAATAVAAGVTALSAAPASAALTPTPCADCKPPSGKPGNAVYAQSRTFACDRATGRRQWMVDFGVPKTFIIPKYTSGTGPDAVTTPAHKPVAVRFYFTITNQSLLQEPGPLVTPGSHVEAPVTVNHAGTETLAIGWVETNADGTVVPFSKQPLGGKTLILSCPCDTPTPVTTTVLGPPVSIVRSTVPTTVTSRVSSPTVVAPAPHAVATKMLPATGPDGANTTARAGLLLVIVGAAVVAITFLWNRLMRGEQ